jgi:hypothetical protein
VRNLCTTHTAAAHTASKSCWQVAAMTMFVSFKASALGAAAAAKEGFSMHQGSCVPPDLMLLLLGCAGEGHRVRP